MEGLGTTYTVSVLARKFGLSRTTLLYYDKIGLLRPSRRQENGYRAYDAGDAARLAQICAYRRYGLNLADIGRILDHRGSDAKQVLARRFEELGVQIQELREQQRQILSLMGSEHLERTNLVMSKADWTALMRAAGFSDADMFAWHVRFEHQAPEQHLKFLKFLCIPDEEIHQIRAWSAAGAKPDG